MAELRTRPPTGQVAFPLILVEHEEKAGGSYALAQFAASPRVGRTFILDTGDGTADEYARLGPYEILVHDGTWPSMIEQIEAATKAPRVDPAKPNVVGIDHGSAIWQMLSLWTDQRARNSNSGRAKLAADPDAEIDATVNLWNDAKSRWGRMMFLLKSFDGIGVVLAHGSEVVEIKDGAPTKNRVWSTVVEKNTAGTVSAIIRVRRDPREARLIGARSLDVEVPTGGLVLPAQGMLDHVIFDVLGAGEGGFVESSAVAAQTGTPTPVAKGRILDAIGHAYKGLTDKERLDEAARLWTAYGLASGVEEVSTEAFTALLVDIADGKTQTPPEEPQEGEGGEPTPEPDPSPQDGTTPAQEPQEEPAAEEAADGTAYVPGSLERLQAAKGRELADWAKALGLPVGGKVEEIRDRIAAHLFPAVEAEAVAKVAEAFGGAEPVEGVLVEPDGVDGRQMIGPDAHPEPDLPEVIDVPEGWDETRCLCGEPMTYKPGDQTRTSRHLDPTLDADHKAEEPF